MLIQEFRHGLPVFTMAGHPNVKALKAKVQHKGALGRLGGAKIPHQLRRAFGDKCASLTELFRIGDAVVALIRCCQPWEFIFVCHPVEMTAVHNGTADTGAMAIHILGGGMGHDVSPPLKGTAVDGGRKGVIHDQRDTVGVSNLSKQLNIQHRQRRIGNGLTKHCLGIGPECCIQLFLRGIRTDKGRLNAHLRHGHADQVKCTAIDGGGRHNMVAAACDIKQRKEVCCLTGGCEHCGGAALQLRDLRRYIIAGGILKPGVKIAAGFQIKKLPHILRGRVLKGRALNDRDLPGLAVSRGIASLNTFGFNTLMRHKSRSFLFCRSIRWARIRICGPKKYPVG